MKIMEYESENRICQNCKKDFVIEPDDFGFYEKIKVPPPTFCPKCRAQNRLCFRNERFLYKRPCDKCKKDIISIFSANKDFPVWCHDCWWNNDLNSKQYGISYDPKISFFEQFKKLWEKVPASALMHVRSVNSEYINLSADSKNCYMIIESSNNENCINCYWIQQSTDLVDCSFTNKVELSYEVDDCYDSHSLCFSRSCYSCLNSSFLLNCRMCSNCLGCINLRGQNYCIFNQQYSKEEYYEKLKSFKLDTYSGVENFKKEFNSFIKDKPRKFAEIYNANNSTGNYMTNIKNNRNCFHSYEAEDNAYSVHVWRGAKDCYDCHTAGRTAERIYNSLNSGMETSDLICCQQCWSCQFTEYSFDCHNSNNCFGCVGLVGSSYCILNKQYTKDEYTALRLEIINNMKKEGTYGDFLPRNISPFGYNETSAMEEFPLSKEEALSQNFKWEEVSRGVFGKETINWGNFPESILDLKDDLDISKEIFQCILCKKNYRIIKNELSFYKKMNLPIPRNCPECRHLNRMKNRGPNKLWHRKCMNDGCNNEFETSYALDRSEIIYCEKCYQQEVY